jgi:excisionase family DNA binding protein
MSDALVIQFPHRPGNEPWLTSAQLAEALQMSERWIAYQVRAGMPSQKFGRARRFRRTEVEEWLKGQGRRPR